MLEDFFEMNTQSGKPRETYMLIDISNHMHRARHGASRSGGTPDDINEYALHIAFQSLNKLFRILKPTKIVACADHGSWRKDVFPLYKENRKEIREKDDGFEAFLEMIEEFKTVLIEHSTMLFLEHPKIEGDDWIAGWTQAHPDDIHIIVSSDGDFNQLISSNVKQYNPVKDEFVDVDDVGFELFLKCIRGDRGDNIPSAYPKIRRDKLKNAYDGDTFLMENIMQHEVPNIEDKDEVGHPKMAKVQKLYDRNKKLIDLTQQPEHIKQEMFDLIKESPNLTGKFEMYYILKYLGSHNLRKIADDIEKYEKMLNL